MRVRNDEIYGEKKKQIMRACYDCYAELGLHGTGISAVAKAAGVSKATLYNYFRDADELITESTSFCMSSVEEEFMARAPQNPGDIPRFIEEIPYWTAKEHGKKYRLMYQVYTHPKYIGHGKRFFAGVNERYSAYAAMLEPKLGIPCAVITPLIFIFVRACVHFALFEDEYYLKSQMEVLKDAVALFLEKYQEKAGAGKESLPGSARME